MAKICWIPQAIHSSGINKLTENNFVPLRQPTLPAADLCAQIEAVIFRSGTFSCSMMAQLPHLKVIAVHGVGTDGIDIPFATQQGIVVLNTPGTNTRSVAEHAIALLFALNKHLLASDQAIRENRYQAFKSVGGLRELQGSTLGIVGFGAIGQCTAALARAIGIKVLVHSRQSQQDIEQAGYRKAADFTALLAESDAVSLHLPAVAETHHLINAETLSYLPPHAFLINTSRGALVDEQALANALINRQIAGAALDVFHCEPLPADDPLLAAPNLIVTPHTAASSEQALINMATAAVDGVLRVMANTPPLSLINPAVWPQRRQ
ncbi:hydroxyacid dehydrogenase [Erwinia endophytica]|uniref:hydroxyacid dehydrogenase n=1 Tax=Erwinia endophytica TaxID=1563158 RepID=UPI001265E3BF|nr:hydroxyacid dehydrogenase [Erwinia endophytica]KAB8306218.1 hydroxyacid dehydrogenase [Erwinia endophytica]